MPAQKSRITWVFRAENRCGKFLLERSSGFQPAFRRIAMRAGSPRSESRRRSCRTVCLGLSRHNRRMSLEVSSPSQRAIAPAFRGVLALVVFGVALFSSAFLLFWIEPLFARMALPRLGGSQGVWNTCLVFFQASLLLGYTYAHVIARYLSLRVQVLVHLAVLAVGAAFLPIAMRVGWAPPPEGSPVLPLLALLTVTLGWPFFAFRQTHRCSSTGSRSATTNTPQIPMCSMRPAMPAASWPSSPIRFCSNRNSR